MLDTSRGVCPDIEDGVDKVDKLYIFIIENDILYKIMY